MSNNTGATIKNEREIYIYMLETLNFNNFKSCTDTKALCEFMVNGALTGTLTSNQIKEIKLYHDSLINKLEMQVNAKTSKGATFTNSEIDNYIYNVCKLLHSSDYANKLDIGDNAIDNYKNTTLKTRALALLRDNIINKDNAIDYSATCDITLKRIKWALDNCLCENKTNSLLFILIPDYIRLSEKLRLATGKELQENSLKVETPNKDSRILGKARELENDKTLTSKDRAVKLDEFVKTIEKEPKTQAQPVKGNA